MTRPTDDILIAFLEGRLDETEWRRLVARLDDDPRLAAELRRAAAGFDRLRTSPATTGGAEADVAHAGGRIAPWWLAVATAATLVVAVPTTAWLVTRPADDAVVDTTMPMAAEASFVLVLRNRWPDAAGLSQTETRRRRAEYWAWTSSLADVGVLMAAGDLRQEPGARLGPAGQPVAVAASVVDDPDYVVGMFVVRVASYAAARALAESCPHLRYGGSVSIRQVNTGFVAVPGMDDWAGRQ